MLGFVSALSASVSVMILLMAVLLANVMSSAMDMEENKHKAKILGIEDNGGEIKDKNKNIHNTMKSLTFNYEILNTIDYNKIKSIEIYCSYGNNLTLDTALTYTVYNTVYLKKNIPQVSIKALKPAEDKNGLNSCFLKGKEKESEKK
ncbi:MULTISPECIES: hypothetical protein [Providencia]|uniref:Uncharacterized protein n=3 Tax=Providencia alcalifaciens TaxID=126385 RepID=A0AAW9VB36_9GAMM|nr:MULTISPECIES: hypothetical protein [Providencia]ETT06672.1 hypothetical protein HMPREF1562_4168 [Providencia alcalifaciens F90-2004]EUC95359.1 hypothetical protein HMPREF1567_3980 [Providencia alcalifaciens PAL-2]EUD12812.1 hypothetical protein HMPREF1563_2385 [Providencia alcalifaciens 205/92]MBF0692765.1 hypothetical protein [Providencia alcalifaciens]MTB32538.1 hypothetical protein [Providencia alcalifaciens]